MTAKDHIDTAMVLAAGLGTRMRALSGDMPKPLVPVLGKPLLDWTLDFLSDGGIRQAVVNLHYKAEMIEAHLAGRTFPKITLSDERGALLETGGGLMKATPLLGKGPVFCSNTDAIFRLGQEHPVTQLQKAWQDDHMDALLLLVPFPMTSGYDSSSGFYMGPGGALRWEGRGEKYVFTGLQIIHPRLWEGEEIKAQSTKVFWDKAMAAGRLYGVIHDETWLHVGDPAGHEAAETLLREKSAE
ncbi:MAG: nucleotidyltransferase family protein [Pseudomonadota bacterium]